ncbi:MAG: gluconokinase [Chloroflexota bacterium]
MNERIIGLDIGTTGTRAIVFDPESQIYASTTADYPLLIPHPGYGEQEPDAILAAVVQALHDAVAQAGLGPNQVTGIGVSAVMHSLIALDADGKPLTNAWTWVDTRAARQSAAIKKTFDAKAIYNRTGCPVHPMYTPEKVCFIRDTMPAVYAKASRYVTIKEYVLSRLFGTHIIDYGIGSGSGCLNMEQKAWDEEVLGIAGIRPEQMARLVEPTDLLRGWRPEFAAKIGISADTPLAVGSSDGTLSSLGAGAVSPGQMTAMIGTSGAVRAISDHPKVDDQGRTWCYYLAAGRWVAGAAINNAGITYRWVRDNLFRVSAEEKDAAYDNLGNAAATVEPGSNGLIFLPFLAGERAPYWNADARGVLFGLSLGHGQPHVVRATLEGVAYRMYSIFVALRDVVGSPREIRATGGFTRSQLWLQILADVFGERLSVPVVHEASSFGGAFLAMMGLGLVRDIEDIQRLVHIESEVAPDAAIHGRYERMFDFYMRMYWHLQDQFAEIAALQRGDEPLSGGKPVK